MTQSTVQIDIINNGTPYGEVAGKLKSQGSFNINSKRPYLDEDDMPCITVFTGKYKGGAENPENYESVHAYTRGINVLAELTLRPDEWKEIDDAVTEVAREELAVYDYFIGKNLVKTLRNAFGTTVLEWHSVSDSQEATMSMDAVNRGQGDRVKYKDNFLPIPILHADYEINARFLEVSRKNGNGVDVEEARNAARKIMDKKEDLLVGSGTYTFGGGTMYTLLNYPDRNQVQLNGAWDASATTDEMIIDDVKRLKKANRDAYHRGEGVLILPDAYQDRLGDDYSISGQSLMTLKERIMKLGNIADIIFSERIADNNVVFVELRRRTIEIINGMPMTNMMWTTEGGMIAKHKIMEIAVPRFKSDFNNHCGIAHGTL